MLKEERTRLGKMFIKMCTASLTVHRHPAGYHATAQKNKVGVYIGMCEELPNILLHGAVGRRGAWGGGWSKFQNDYRFGNDPLTQIHLPARIFSAGRNVAQHHWGTTPLPVLAVGTSQRWGREQERRMGQGISSHYSIFIIPKQNRFGYYYIIKY